CALTAVFVLTSLTRPSSNLNVLERTMLHGRILGENNHRFGVQSAARCRSSFISRQNPLRTTATDVPRSWAISFQSSPAHLNANTILFLSLSWRTFLSRSTCPATPRPQLPS